LTANDQIAVGALVALKELKLEVPGDVSVIGYSNAPISPYTIPSLTTIDQFSYNIGRMAGTKILQMIESYDSVKSVMMIPELLVRNSTGPPRAE